MDNEESDIPTTQAFGNFQEPAMFNDFMATQPFQIPSISVSGHEFSETQVFETSSSDNRYDDEENVVNDDDIFAIPSTQHFEVSQAMVNSSNMDDGFLSTQPFNIPHQPDDVDIVNQTLPFDVGTNSTQEFRFQRGEEEEEESFVEAEDNPVSPDENPVSPDENPVSPDENPVSPDENPVSPDENPVSPDECPASPDAVAPVVSDTEERPKTPESLIENEENGSVEEAIAETREEDSVEIGASKISSDNEDAEDEAPAKSRKLRISSDDEGDNNEVEGSPKQVVDNGEQVTELEDDNEDQKSEVNELIADIFGESDEEGGNEAAVVQQPEEVEPDNNERLSDGLDDFGDGDDNDTRRDRSNQEMSDFDVMMEKRKLENSKRRRKRKDYDMINDSDDMINELLHQMKHAAKEDVELNSQRLPASKKRKLLTTVMSEFKKDWLTPLPDRSLPALEIRTELLKLLQQFPSLDHQILRSSNIGKAVMLLYKHPKETKENKDRAGRIIRRVVLMIYSTVQLILNENEWARPIFNLQSDYRSLSKDERLKRDFDHMPQAKKRRMSSLDSENPPASTSKPNTSDEKVLGPGDKGFIIRARVPRPSTRDYVVRPKWNIETQFRKSSKKSASAMDRKIREYQEKARPKKFSHAVEVSIEGRKLAL